MKKLIPRPLPNDPLPTWAADDIARIVAYVASAGYVVSAADAETIWSRYCLAVFRVRWAGIADEADIEKALRTCGQVVEVTEGGAADAAEAVKAMQDFMQTAPGTPAVGLKALITEGRAGDAEVATAVAELGRPAPPEGYANWLDYAVATMDTRSIEVALSLEDVGSVPTRDQMRAAVAAELAELRQSARELALIDNAPLIAAERARLARERERREDQALNKIADARAGQPSTKIRLDEL